MKISNIRKQAHVIDSGQLSKIKGGSNESNPVNFIIVDDIDVF